MSEEIIQWSEATWFYKNPKWSLCDSVLYRYWMSDVMHVALQLCSLLIITPTLHVNGEAGGVSSCKNCFVEPKIVYLKHFPLFALPNACLTLNVLFFLTLSLVTIWSLIKQWRSSVVLILVHDEIFHWFCTYILHWDSKDLVLWHILQEMNLLSKI